MASNTILTIKFSSRFYWQNNKIDSNRIGIGPIDLNMVILSIQKTFVFTLFKFHAVLHYAIPGNSIKSQPQSRSIYNV